MDFRLKNNLTLKVESLFNILVNARIRLLKVGGNAKVLEDDISKIYTIIDTIKLLGWEKEILLTTGGQPRKR